MTKWMAVNSECIYGTRPWAIYGEGPSVKNDATAMDAAVNPPRGLGPNSDRRHPFHHQGRRVLRRRDGAAPRRKGHHQSSGANSAHYPGEIGRVQMLGSAAKLGVHPRRTGLSVTIPDAAASDYANALKITKA